MRNARLLIGLAVLVVSTWAVRAEPVPYTITATEVMVRSGPSPEFYATGKLGRGDTVRVRGEETTGWLAIVPPPGSFSWINARFVEQMGSNRAVVKAAEAPIRVGSRLVNQEPTVERIRVAAGTIVTIIGKPEAARDGTWLPILPVPSEARFIPAEAVRPNPPQVFAAASSEPPKPSAAQAGFASPRPPAAGPAATASAGNPIPSSSPQAPANPTNPLWLQAEAAERSGNIAQAQALFEQLAQQVQSTDHELWVRCLNRLQALREGRGNGFSASSPSPLQASTNRNSGLTAERLVPSPAGSPALPQTPRALSEYCYLRDSAYTARLEAPVLNVPNPPAAPSGQWYEPGRLCRTTFFLDGKTVYRFEPIEGKNRMWIYVTAGDNANLEPYVGRIVSLYGPMTYRGDLRTNYMAVLQVSPIHSAR
jgi:uncharacterized protein YraI